MTPVKEVTNLTELSKPTDYQSKTEAYLPRITAVLEQTFNNSDLILTPQNGATEVTKHVGKVRDRYEDGKNVVLVTTDRLTGFDRALAKIPFKGQILNLISRWWFEQTQHIMANHVLSVPHPNVTIATAVVPFKVEFVVRGYLSGSTKTSILPFYLEGGREFCGNKLEEGLLPHRKLSKNIITPTSKSDTHDESLTPEQIVEEGLMTQLEWDECSKLALELFDFAQNKALERGLILVDTKMEMGRTADGRIILIDELFTPDSSRYWVAKEYEAALATGVLPPKGLDKEFIRLWFKDNCDPYNDEILPTAPAELIAELSRRYIMAFEMITGTDFNFTTDLTAESINVSVQKALAPPAPVLNLFNPNKRKELEPVITVDRDHYVSALKRYAPKEMSELWSERNKFGTWRKVWVALAEAQHKIGIYDPQGRERVSAEQVAELRAAQNLNDDEFIIAEKREEEVKHDVMSHIYAYGLRCPLAKDIIHLGATSMDVQDNAELMMMRQAMELVRADMFKLLTALRKFVYDYKDLPTLGFTHFQAAQLVTVGKRAAMWGQGFILMFNKLVYEFDNLPARGAQGATGTQGTFLELFDNDHDKVDEFNELFCQLLGFETHLDVTGQTYHRIIDHNVLTVLGGIGACVENMCSDLRILIGKKELTEGRGKKQVGSSAMAYKRNPILSESSCGLSQLLAGISAQPAETLTKQWLERTLNDSANRRFVIPEAFLHCSSVLNRAAKIITELEVWPKMISKNMADELPFMATEKIMMACVKAGGDRQILHDAIHRHSTETQGLMMDEGASNDLLSRIKKDPLFAAVHDSLDNYTDPRLFIGRAPQIAERFCTKVLDPLLAAEEELRKTNSSRAVWTM